MFNEQIIRKIKQKSAQQGYFTRLKLDPMYGTLDVVLFGKSKIVKQSPKFEDWLVEFLEPRLILHHDQSLAKTLTQRAYDSSTLPEFRNISTPADLMPIFLQDGPSELEQALNRLGAKEKMQVTQDAVNQWYVWDHICDAISDHNPEYRPENLVLAIVPSHMLFENSVLNELLMPRAYQDQVNVQGYFSINMLDQPKYSPKQRARARRQEDIVVQLLANEKRLYDKFHK